MLRSLKRQNATLTEENQFYKERIDKTLQVNTTLLDLIDDLRTENKKLLDQVELLDKWNRELDAANWELVNKVNGYEYQTYAEKQKEV